MKMQGMLGNVKEDGILGPETLASLQELQGVSPQPTHIMPDGSEMPGATHSGGEMEDEYGDMVSYGDPAPAGQYETQSIDETEPAAPETQPLWNQAMGASSGGGTGYGEDSGPQYTPQYEEDEQYGGPINQRDLNDAIRMRSSVNANEANERYYDKFFDEDKYNLGGYSQNPNAPYYSGSNEPQSEESKRYQESEGFPLDESQLSGTSNVQDPDMGEAPSQNNIFTAMNNNKSDEELIKTGKMINPNTGDIEQLEEMLDDDGNFMGWQSPQSNEDNLNAIRGNNFELDEDEYNETINFHQNDYLRQPLNQYEQDSLRRRQEYNQMMKKYKKKNVSQGS